VEADPFARLTAAVSFSPNLRTSLDRAAALAAERKHDYTTLEHLLLALTDDAGALAVMQACEVRLPELRAMLIRYVDDDLGRLGWQGDEEPRPTAGLYRVMQRAVTHVRSAGRELVTGANILVAIFSEAESQAYVFLTAQGIDRSDLVNFIAHGIRKGGAAA